jgi:subtilisin-like proprotein convertase family protein
MNFRIESPEGTWRLYVEDVVEATSGFIHGWSITLYYEDTTTGTTGTSSIEMMSNDFCRNHWYHR